MVEYTDKLMICSLKKFRFLRRSNWRVTAIWRRSKIKYWVSTDVDKKKPYSFEEEDKSSGFSEEDEQSSDSSNDEDYLEEVNNMGKPGKASKKRMLKQQVQLVVKNKKTKAGETKPVRTKAMQKKPWFYE